MHTRDFSTVTIKFNKHLRQLIQGCVGVYVCWKKHIIANFEYGLPHEGKEYG